jgi:hypothetical protein
MIRSLGVIAVVGLLAAPAAAGAQEAYTIKLKRAGQGQTSLVDKTESATQAIKVADNNGNVLQEKDEKQTKHMVYKETVLEKKAGQRATRLKRQYEKATVTVGGDTKTLPYQGKTVLIEKKDGKYTFRIEGGEELTGEDAQQLKEEFSKGKLDDEALEKLFLPKRPVKVGETWQIDPALLAKGLQEDARMEVNVEKSKASGKLLKAYKKDGRQFGVLQLNLDIVPKSFSEGGMKVVLQPGAKMVVELKADACIDGSISSGTATSDVTVSAEALLPNPEQPMAKLTINVKAKGTEKNVEQ